MSSAAEIITKEENAKLLETISDCLLKLGLPFHDPLNSLAESYRNGEREEFDEGFFVTLKVKEVRVGDREEAEKDLAASVKKKLLEMGFSTKNGSGVLERKGERRKISVKISPKVLRFPPSLVHIHIRPAS